MKVAVLLAYAVLTTRRVSSAAIKAPLDIISLDDISETDRKELDLLNRYYYPPRPKRSSSQDAFHSIKASIGNGIKSKLSLLARGSATASTHFIGGSSHSYHHPEPHDHKSFDFWSLKKSILNTLLQAVKAIKGGVIAINGQLIKGSGYLISAKGRLISAKGEAISNLGKNIATSAVLSHPHGHSEEYSHVHHHEHSGPSEEYGSPSAPGPEYELPDHYHHHSPHHEDTPDFNNAGILILKKIPVHDHLPVEHKVPDFKPIDHAGPSFGDIVGKFFSASTSLKPGYPPPFEDEHAHIYHEQDHVVQHHHDDHHVPSHSQHYYHDHDPRDHGDHVPSHEEYRHAEPPPSHVDNEQNYPPPDHHPKDHTLFEEAPSFLNVGEYASESKGSPPNIYKTNVTSAPQIVKNTQNYDEVRPLPTSLSNVGFDSQAFLTESDKINLLGGSFDNANRPSYAPLANPPNIDNQFGVFPGTNPNDLKYLAPPDAGPQIFPNQNSFSQTNSYAAYPQSVKQAYLESEHLTQYNKRPTRSKVYNRKRPISPPPNPSYKHKNSQYLGPNRPKRL